MRRDGLTSDVGCFAATHRRRQSHCFLLIFNINLPAFTVSPPPFTSLASQSIAAGGLRPSLALLLPLLSGTPDQPPLPSRCLLSQHRLHRPSQSSIQRLQLSVGRAQVASAKLPTCSVAADWTVAKRVSLQKSGRSSGDSLWRGNYDPVVNDGQTREDCS